MIFSMPSTRVYLATGCTDMRKAISGLSILVGKHLELDPFSGHYFAFCNHRKNIIKILYWDRDGYAIWQKRLEEGTFRFPADGDGGAVITPTELAMMLGGVEVSQVRRTRRRYSRDLVNCR